MCLGKKRSDLHLHWWLFWISGILMMDYPNSASVAFDHLRLASWRWESKKKCKSLKAYSQSRTLSNKPHSVFLFASMLPFWWMQSDKQTRIFSLRGADFPCRYRLSLLWVIAKQCQVMPASTEQVQPGRYKTTETGLLTDWWDERPICTNVKIFKAHPLIQIIRFVKLSGIKRAL